MGFDGKHIVDKFGRVHDYLRISLTERCNLRCFYCMPEEGIPLREKDCFMNSEELIQIATTFVELGVKKIRLTGGEPLIKKNIDQVLKELSKLPVEIALTTNGVLLDTYHDLLKECGVQNLNISLDSLKEERFNSISRRDYFSRIMRNILLMLKSDFKVKINVVLMKGVNDDEVIDFIEWTKDKAVDVRFIEFMPFDGNNWNSEKKVSAKEILEKVSSTYGADKIIRKLDSPNDTARNYKIEGFKGSFGVISSVTNPFCSTCNRIRLTADGKIKNCLFSQQETDLLSVLREGGELKPLIVESIHSKFKERGGIGDFEKNTSGFLLNRSMVRIGG